MKVAYVERASLLYEDCVERASLNVFSFLPQLTYEWFWKRIKCLYVILIMLNVTMIFCTHANVKLSIKLCYYRLFLFISVKLCSVKECYD